MSIPPEPPSSPPGATEACANCGAPVRPDQDWCLNCGAALTTRVAQTPNWRTPLAIVGVILALAAAGIVVAFLELSDDADDVAAVATSTTSTQPAVAASGPTGPSGPSGPTVAATGPTGPTGPFAGTTGPTGPASTTPTTAEVPTITSGTPTTSTLPDIPPLGDPAAGDDDDSDGSSGTVSSWPSGEEAWTVILLSARRRADADRRARQLANEGTSVGVLDSDEYEGLRGGYFVVFSGQYESRSSAQSAAEGLRSKSPSAYVRFIDPR